MLVRLFIGLILLTTLTSDGTSMLPNFLRSMYFSQEPELVQNESAEFLSVHKKPLPVDEGSFCFAGFAPYRFFSAVVSYSNKTNYMGGMAHTFPPCQRIVHDEPCKGVYIRVPYAVDRHILTIQSDLSPPVAAVC